MVRAKNKVCGFGRRMLPLAVVLCAGLCVSPAQAQPLDPTFTHQGELQDAGSPANGNYDFRFRVYDALIGGVQQGPQLLATAAVSNGKYTVALNFTAAAFNGDQRWLEIDVRPAGGGAYTMVTPRQPLTASPHAWYSVLAGTAANATNLNNQPGSFYTNATNLGTGTLPGARLAGVYGSAVSFTNPANSYTGVGTGLTALNASNVSGGTLADARLSANVDLLNIAQAFTAAKNFTVSPAFTSAGAPFTVTSSTLVTNLNADLLDGMNSTAFSLSGHVHNAADITAGILSDARLSSNVALLNTVQTFTANKRFDANVGFGTAASYPIHVVDNDGGYPVAVFADTSAAGSIVTYGERIEVDANSTHYGIYADLGGAGTGAGFSYYTYNPTPGGHGFRAFMSGSTGSSVGISVSNSSTSGRGGEFINTAASGTTYGLWAENNSPDGYGVYALHDATTGTGPAVYARTDSTAASAYAVHGVVNTTSAGGSSAAIRGQNLSTTSSGVGVYGTQAGTGYGVWGSAATGGRGVYGDAGGEGYGVYGSTDDGQGVYGLASPTTTTETCYGGYFTGGNSDFSRGVYGTVSGGGIGVYGYSSGGYGGYFDTGVASGVALYVVGTASVGVITIRGGADLAENFEFKSETTVEPGMVVMIDDEHAGGMEIAVGAYNRRVAGIVSGAKELDAGMVLGEFEGLENAKPIALSGRVWTYVDATSAAVEPGDLLTTSDTPGYAMPVVDNDKAHGATIGKAMSRLEKGEKGMVLVLVNLQ
ncbi:hypothetical protein PHYC_00894 [Phycisphaerales bacterium]|nr:hypothetical protein PHYC_00894 [Phycisphaerales bacterium]